MSLLKLIPKLKGKELGCYNSIWEFMVVRPTVGLLDYNINKYLHSFKLVLICNRSPKYFHLNQNATKQVNICYGAREFLSYFPSFKSKLYLLKRLTI